MKTKRIYIVIITMVAIAMGALFASCSDDDKETDNTTTTDKTEVYLKRLDTLLDEAKQLQGQAVYGELTGEYPISSKVLINNQVSYLETTISQIKEGIKKLLDNEMDKIIATNKDVMTKFKDSKRQIDFQPLPAELKINGNNGGYIDFGTHPEYSNFGELGKQVFTVEFWAKVETTNGFYFLLSTFTDDDANDHERMGWCVNNHFGAFRMTYGMGFNDLFEPGFAHTILDEWFHVAVVTNELGVDGETAGGKPKMMKIYINGELKKEEQSNQNEKYYQSSNKKVSMIAFTGLNVKGERIEDKGTNGSMKHMHIWKSAKTQTEIQNIMSNPNSISGSESDLVCGWMLDRTVANEADIKDITGKYTAKLVGSYAWLVN